MADITLAELRADATHLAPGAPELDGVIEDAGRQRLAAYYLYTALIAGVIGDEEIAPSRWPPALAEPMNRMGLTRLAPRTERGLDAELTPAEQATRRGPGRELEFAQLAADLINHGAFGPLSENADTVRLAGASDAEGIDLELIAGDSVVGGCKAKDQWELVAQSLAGALHGEDPLADASARPAFARRAASRLKETGISHTVSVTTKLAVGISPIGTAAGVGTKLVRSRIQTGRKEAEALRDLSKQLRTLRTQAEGELRHRQD